MKDNIKLEVRTIEKKITVYVTEDGEEFDTEEEAKEHLAEEALEKVDKYESGYFGATLFRIKSKEEFEKLKHGYSQIYNYCFSCKFNYKKEIYPLYCMWDGQGGVYAIKKELYDAMIEFDKSLEKGERR